MVSRVWTLAFWRTRTDAPEGDVAAAAPSALLDDTEDILLAERDDVGRMPVGMLVPTGALIAVGLTLTVLAGPIFGYSDRAAAEVLDRGRYITAVLGVRRDRDEKRLPAAGVGALLADAGLGVVVGQRHPANIIGGLAVALVITLLLPLPAVPVEGRLHPLSLLAAGR